MRILHQYSHGITSTAVVSLLLVQAAQACPGDMFKLSNSSLNLGTRTVGVRFTAMYPARATSVSWPPGVRFAAQVLGSGIQLNGISASGFNQGSNQPFDFTLDLTVTGTGNLSSSLRIGAICNPDFPGNLETGSLIATGTGGGTTPPPTPGPSGPRTFYTTSYGGHFGDPVSTATGELFGYDDVVDLVLGGPLPLRLHRYYASYLRANGFTSAVGANWMHNFDARMAVSGTNATVRLFRGVAVAFTQSGGVWQLAGRERAPYQLVSAGSDYRFYDPASNLIYTFNATGALIRIEDRNGNALTVTPEAGNIGPARVTDGVGRTLTFTYAGGRLVRAGDQSGRTVSYEVSGENLASFTDANGKKALYTYTTAGGLTSLLSVETRPAGNKPVTSDFDPRGRVFRQTDSQGNVRLVEYPATTGNAAVTQPSGAAFAHAHDAALNLTRYIDAMGLALSITYDSNNRPTGVTNRLGDRIAGTWDDATGLPTSYTDELGNTTRATYASQTQGGFNFSNLATVSFADGTSTRFTYDERGNLTEYADHAGKTWKATYNQRGQIEAVTNPTGGVTTRTYNTDGTLASTRSDAGEATRYVYDSAYRLTELLLPGGQSQRFLYDSRNNLVRRTAPGGNTTTFSYDDNNNLRSVADPTGAATTSAYDTNDRLSSVTDPLGKTTRFTYDSAGRRQSIANPAGNRIAFAYDAQNRLTSAVDGASKGATFAYDREDRLVSVTDALGRIVRFTRDKRGDVTRLNTPGGENYDTTYDSMRRPLTSTDPLGRTTRTTYDLRGQIRGLEIPGGITTTLERTDLGAISRIVDPNGSAWLRRYDPAGRMTSSVDPLGRATSFSFQGNRVSRIDLPDTTAAPQASPAGRQSSGRSAGRAVSLGSVQFTYAGGGLTRAQYSDSIDLAYTYDAANRLTTAANLSLAYDRAGRIVTSNGLQIERDDAGRILSVTYAAGKTVRYTYDARGLLTRVADWIGGLTELTFDDARQLTALTRPNGVREEYTYDRNARLASTRITRGGTTISTITIRRDAAGQVTSVDRTAPPAPDVANGSAPFAYDAAHQVVGSTYDALGRLTSDGIRTYTWDLASRLTAYTGADGSATFTYDGLGQRVSRNSGGVTRSYVLNYANAQPTVDVVRSGGADQRYYIYLPDGTVLQAVESSGARRYYHFDENASTSFLTDDAGAVTDTWVVTPYGETVARTGTTENPFTFHGAFGVMQEGATQLYYMRARYYDGASARFLSRDPAPGIDPRAVNPYEFALGNPLEYRDPSGLYPAEEYAEDGSQEGAYDGGGGHGFDGGSGYLDGGGGRVLGLRDVNIFGGLIALAALFSENSNIQFAPVRQFNLPGSQVAGSGFQYNRFFDPLTSAIGSFQTQRLRPSLQLQVSLGAPGFLKSPPGRVGSIRTNFGQPAFGNGGNEFFGNGGRPLGSGVFDRYGQLQSMRGFACTSPLSPLSLKYCTGSSCSSYNFGYTPAFLIGLGVLVHIRRRRS